MRILPLALALCATSAFAQLGAPNPVSNGFQRTWTFGAQSYGPTLTGHFEGSQDGKPIFLDLDGDLGLGRDKTTPGLFLDYQGPRFAFQVSSGSADYKGDRTVTRTVTLNGTSYTAGTRVLSHVKLASVDGVWTIKFVRDTDTWLGLDLGVQAWTLDMDASSADPALPMAASTRVTAPIPQIGLSGGSRGFNGAVESKAYFHYLGYKQAKYTLFGVDLRVFPVNWFGLRAFYEGGSFKVPKGSIKDDLDFQLDRKGVGLGAVVRF
ncbi:hypothetical protein GETHLI_23730 [Geothrix limicola]|uniref:Outer membrane protein beta-barrel domain-containing protein n=1 Tax=Geothrix limicola TaxID=2927978 RepID=A0ABQ5QHR2_9BACT|nr:hypothetical protein [Geothrix limicola]GLH73871.1 hypothetical protein GETHLI_23730 [Geothrix limicola]